MTAETQSSNQQIDIGVVSRPALFSVGATAIEALWGILSGIAMSG